MNHIRKAYYKNFKTGTKPPSTGSYMGKLFIHTKVKKRMATFAKVCSDELSKFSVLIVSGHKVGYSHFES